MLIHPGQKNKPIFFIIFGILLLIGLVILFFSNYFFSAPQKESEPERFIIQMGINNSDKIKNDLYEKGFIKNKFGFGIALGCFNCVQEGAYKISKSMSAWEIAKTIKGDPYMVWVIIKEGYRKEQIGEIFVKEFGWSDEKYDEFIKETNNISALDEGIFFPDTYLIPVDESPSDIVKRLYTRFNEKFEPFSKEAINQNIKWTTLIKIASLVEREAGGEIDMPLVAGILWNRLLQEMKLDIDATIQYARGDKGDGWWAPISVADKKINSPYNTYMYKGLPPHPIANPGIDAISAVLYPEKTDCLYYLHDSSREIHCAKDYESHKENIEKYLKN